MSGNKRLPFDKTFVLEYKGVLADTMGRTVLNKGSTALPIMLEAPFQNGDINISSAAAFEVTDVKTFVILTCYDPFVVTITDAQGTQVSLTSSGLFMYTGAIPRLMVTPYTTALIRLQYIWS
jgi:hypothetical protein